MAPSLVQLFLFLLAYPAFSADERYSCEPNKGWCNGDSSFVETNGKLVFEHIHPNRAVKDQKYAAVRRDHCVQDQAKELLCPGDRVLFENRQGVVLGIFADGNAVVSTTRRYPEKIPTSALRVLEWKDVDPRALRETVRNLASLNEILGQEKDSPCEHLWQEPALPAEKNPSSVECNEESAPVTADDSPNRKHFEELLAKGLTAPLEDFLTLWYPDRGDKDLDSPFFACEVQKGGAFRIRWEETLKDNCKPDALYSWGPHMKVNDLQKTMSDNSEWKGSPNPSGKIGSGKIFTTLSPASTFGFGSVLMRFRPHPHTPFKTDNGDDRVGISVRTDSFHDFVIADSSLIENWSFGTPEIYDELVRDIKRYESDKDVSIYAENGGDKGTLSHSGLDRLLRQSSDSHRNDEEKLKMNLLELIRQILMREGRIYYAKGACRNRALTYSTDKPSYINPISSDSVREKQAP